jgi:hypothetical protein
MKSYPRWFLLIFFMVFLTRCERDEPLNWGPIDCSTCYQDKPDFGPLQIYVSINKENPFVPLIIYRGDIESNVIEYIDTAYSSDWLIDVPVDEYYSVVAEYKEGPNTIFAVDGDKFQLEKNSSDCDAECYYFKGGYIDVQLRN